MLVLAYFNCLVVLVGVRVLGLKFGTWSSIAFLGSHCIIWVLYSAFGLGGWLLGAFHFICVGSIFLAHFHLVCNQMALLGFNFCFFQQLSCTLLEDSFHL